MMKVWAVANQKGGVGKTTTAVSLAGLLAQRDKSVLLIDMDPHGSLTSYFGHNPEEIEDSIYNLFYADNHAVIKSLIKETTVERLKLIPANPALATLDRQLGIRNSMGLVLARSLSQLTPVYDYVLLDCPPMLGILMVNALAACHQLIIPVQTEYLALKGLERMKRTIEMMGNARKVAVPCIIVPTMFDRRTKEAFRSMEILQEEHHDTLWSSVIPVDTKFREASRARLPISHAVPGSRGARAYSELLDSMLFAGEPVEALVEEQ